jgi:hypothetical protein
MEHDNIIWVALSDSKYIKYVEKSGEVISDLQEAKVIFGTVRDCRYNLLNID